MFFTQKIIISSIPSKGKTDKTRALFRKGKRNLAANLCGFIMSFDNM